MSKELSSFHKPVDSGEKKYFYIVKDGYIELYREREPYQAPPVPPEVQEKNERRAKLDEMRGRCYKLREDFVMQYTTAKSHAKEIMRFAVRSFLCEDGGYVDGNNLIEAVGHDIEGFETAIADTPEKALLITAYYNSGDDDRTGYHDWSSEYGENPDLDLIYEDLISLGYQLSDEETAYRNGTHELFLTEEE